MALTEETVQDKIEIQGYEGLYSVTSDGRVWSHPKGTNTKNGRWLSLDNSGRYPVVGLMKDGKKKRHSVHRLVAQAYVLNPNNLPQVNHINGNRTDNRAENLEWVTSSENRIHAWNTGLQVATEDHKASARKAGYGRRLFSMEQAEDIRAAYASGDMNQYELAAQYNTSQAVINGIVLNKTYTKEAA
jgi:hypothetical protein